MAKVNEANWRMVRLRLSTVEALRGFEARLRLSYERGQQTVGPNDRDQISFDHLIHVLLVRESAHAERSRKRRKKQPTESKGE